MTRPSLNFNERPILVFWETTKSCLLACRHCRAEAMEEPMPGQLSFEEGKRFIESLLSFGRPYPVLIMTGGDVLMREDIFALADYAKELGIPVGFSPSVTPKLTDDAIERMGQLGVKAVSISLDGASSATHDAIRGVEGHFEQTVRALKKLADAGFTVQVNTAIMRDNVMDLPAIVQIMKETGVSVWEVFYLIHVGRGQNLQELTPFEYEQVSHFLYDASRYEIPVRTVEGPFFRRIITQRHNDPILDLDTVRENYELGDLYTTLRTDLEMRLGKSQEAARSQTSGTRDGKGIIFIAHDGTVYPAGFLPLSLGNIKDTPLTAIYRDHPLLQKIRNAEFTGRCGSCTYRDLCGGSRARAFAATGDPLGEDHACDFTF
nr:TIGR04053 family radical SAM/SPASM domain-containing protein [Bacilli bacterium]